MSRAFKYRAVYEAVKGSRGLIGSVYGRTRWGAVVRAIHRLLRAGYLPTHIRVETLPNESVTGYARRKWSGR